MNACNLSTEESVAEDKELKANYVMSSRAVWATWHSYLNFLLLRKRVDYI